MPIRSSAGKENNKALPYGRLRLAVKYLRYWLSASNGKGHGAHSPFLYDFIRQVLLSKRNTGDFKKVKSIRRQLLANTAKIQVDDFGAGSSVINTRQRKVSDIASSSLKPTKYAGVLFGMAKYYKPSATIELGTSFGITTALMAMANPNGKVFTLEGAASIAQIAKHNFRQLGLKNIELITGDFDNTLQAALQKIGQIDMAFIDGNHRLKPTLAYFETMLPFATSDSLFIFDDIHWSPEMEQAWLALKGHPAVTLTIDLFFLGIVVLSKDIRIPRHFVIRY